MTRRMKENIAALRETSQKSQKSTRTFAKT